MNNAEKIRATLGGFSPFVRQPTAPATPAAPPPPAASAPPKVLKAPTVRATTVSVPFFENMRKFQPDAAQTFEMEQRAAKKYREEIRNENAPVGYDMPGENYFTPAGSVYEMNTPILELATSKPHAARIAFVDWLKTDQPDIYARLIQIIGEGPLSADEKVPLWERLTSGLTTLMATYAGAQAQKKILDLNMQRAAEGLPPVDATSMAPVVRTEVAITPEMAHDLRAGANKALMYGGIAAALVAGYFLLKK